MTLLAPTLRANDHDDGATTGALGGAWRRAQATADDLASDLARSTGTIDDRLAICERTAYRIGELIGHDLVDVAVAADLIDVAATACGLHADAGVDTVQEAMSAGFRDGGRAAREERTAADAPPIDPVELKVAGLTQRDALLSVCDDVELWRSADNETFATVSINGHAEHYSVDARTFRDWVIGQVARRYRQNGRPASVGEAAFRDAKVSLQARAHVDGLRHKAPLRVAEHDGSIYIDQGSDDWSAICVSRTGWGVVAKPPIPIIRSRRTSSFPALAPSGDFAPLMRLFGRMSEDDRVMLIAWCLGAMLPDGPYPILIIGGEAGSGKSTFARLLQRLIDPVAGDLLQPPRDDRDLIAAARHGRVLSFDNLSGLRSDMADSLCRLSTGSEIGGRALYSDYDTATFSACRPIILNGIPDLAARGDLSDRSIVMRLDPLDARITEADWRRQVEAALPSAIAALLDALCVGLLRLDDVATPKVRMADFARLVVASEPALPWEPGKFLQAYSGNRQQATAALVEGDLVASLVRDFIEREGGVWQGLKSKLYAALSERVSIEAKRSGDWPGNARWFSDRLSRAAPALRALGIEISEKRTGPGQTLTIRG